MVSSPLDEKVLVEVVLDSASYDLKNAATHGSR